MSTTSAADGAENLIPLLYRVEEAMQLLRLSRTVIYELIRSGRLRSVKEGRARLIPASAIREYLSLLEREAA
ncbi:helix-turn-helix domain-containing protein [Spongisporangium articulatum]|uniref:Helix-turn-helix domain-containing protein n=1 Tax=Spongisporangium articulatum TaxID=3362603 RepID=A0ABW8AJW4_9ACTN